MKKVLLPLFLILFIQCFRAQESAPSLSLGLDDVLFGKGMIDVDLLTDIISEKQTELKKRIVEQEILKPVYLHSSFATSNYAFSVVKELMNEKDKSVMKKEILEHTVNYAVVSAFAEMYVQLSWEEIINESLFDSLGIISDKYNFNKPINFNSDKNDFLNSKLFLTANIEIYKTKSSDTVKYELNKLIMDAVFHAVKNNKTFIEKGFFSKPMYFNHDQYVEKSYYLQNKQDVFVKALYEEVKDFVDNISELYEAFNEVHKYYESTAGKSDFTMKEFMDYLGKKLKNNGFEILNQTKHELQNQTEELEYKMTLANGQIQANDRKIKVWAKELNNAKKKEFKETDLNISQTKLERDISSYFELKTIDTIQFNKIFPNLSYAKSQQEFFASLEMTSVFKELKTTIKEKKDASKAVIEFNRLLDLAADKLASTDTLFNMPSELQLKYVFLDPLKSKLYNLADSLTNNNMDSIMLKLYQHYYFIENNTGAAQNLDYISKVKLEFLPKLGFANLKSGGKISGVIELFENLLLFLETEVYNPINTKLSSGNFSKLSRPFRNIFDGEDNILQMSYLKFFEKLDQLDKMETYYSLLHDMLQTGEMSSNRDIANAMNLILKNIEKYTEFNADNDRIDIDVESVIEALFIKYGSRDKNPFNFYFTLGLNTSFAIGADSNHVNFNSASEKIGLKFNLYNAKLRNSYAYGESKVRKDELNLNEKLNYRSEDPILSDLHLLVYGSGLLYQVANLTTSENVNSTFVGGGLGMTFYNGLCFNTSVMFPVFEQESFGFKKPYINVGFDIQFVEYITALNKKRKENKKQESEMEAEIELKKLEIEKLKIEKEIKKY